MDPIAVVTIRRWVCAALPGAALLGAVTAGCSGPQCANEAFFGLPSPDSTSIAYVFHRRCESQGVTTEVSVLEFHSALRAAPGNVLAVDEEQPVRVAWLGAHKLLVTGFAPPVRLRNARQGAVEIEFRPSGP